MKRLACLAALAILVAGPVRADDAAADVTAVMEEYFRLWNAHDAAAITARIYRFDRPHPWRDAAGLEAEFARLKAQGYDHSVKQSIESCRIGRDVALSEFRFSRLRADGAPLGPKDYATLYLLRRFPDGWRITQLIGMSPTAQLSCQSATDPPAR